MPVHYPRLLDPSVYPDYTRRPIRVPTWETFHHTTQFTTLRCFSIRDGRLVNWERDLDLYTREFKLGRLIWPVFDTVFAENFKDLVAGIKERGLYLFDIWGHIPGSSCEGMWSHVMPPEGMVEYLQQELGERFIGIDNGEQDGRYVSSYAKQQCPSHRSHYRQYLNFQRHFERLCNDLGNHMSTLVSLCFGHYFLKEGNHTLIGAETAQALPNSQVYYAFIRGAGKQYGVPWFGNASVFNRWGYKTYYTGNNEVLTEGPSANVSAGPTYGTSLNLLKRLIYTHYMYNCVAIGFEQSWIRQDDTEKRLTGQTVVMEKNPDEVSLSPVGTLQAETVKFVEKHGQPGVMHTPAALLLDFFAGWAMPRNLYSRHVYESWGALPYNAGDYLTHGLISLLYPGYEDSSYYRDEKGFLSPTPHGDMADCLLSDTPLWVLKQYGLVVAAGKLRVDEELKDKLATSVSEGGHLVVTAENARNLFPDWAIGKPVKIPAQTNIRWFDGVNTTELQEYSLCSVTLPANARILARRDNMPAVAEIPMGSGKVTLLLSPFGLNDQPLTTGPIINQNNTPLDCPFVLLDHVRRILSDALQSQQIFSVGEDLGFITCRRREGEYTLAIYNNSLTNRPFSIVSHCGEIASIQEMEMSHSEKQAEGYWPQGYEDNQAGVSSADTIAGGDIRLFHILIKEKGLMLASPPTPPERPSNRMLSLHDITNLKEALLRWPTYFQHFDGVKIDWTYLSARDSKQIKVDADWLKRQSLKIVVDFTPGLNFYPGLTLLNTLKFRYQESIEAIQDVFDKMSILGATDAVMSLHCPPENHCDEARAAKEFLAGMRDVCRRALKEGITIHLQHSPHNWHGKADETLAFVQEVNAENLRFCLNTGHINSAEKSCADILAAAGKQLGMILLSAPGLDNFGQYTDAHFPLSLHRDQPAGDIDVSFLRTAANVPHVLDADYESWDQVYRDLLTWSKNSTSDGS